MQPKTISYAYLHNMGNFENERIEIAYELSTDDDPAAVLDAARTFVAAQLATGREPASINWGDDGPPPGDPDWQDFVAATPHPAAGSVHEAATHTAAENGQIARVQQNAAAQRGTGTITVKQERAIYAIGRNARHLTDEQVQAEARRIYGCHIAELSKAEASQLIDVLKGEAAS